MSTPPATHDDLKQGDRHAPEAGGRPRQGRLEAIDFLRGVAILEMTVTHFSGLFVLTVQKIIAYTETAMALFVLLAGFMVGWHYFARFADDRRRVTTTLLYRALQILVVQYIVILTVSLPFHLLGYGEIGRDEPLWLFLLKSATFQNQIGIIHILPTFIPLFLVSPLILYLFHKRLDPVLFVGSAALFALGNVSPYLFDLGDRTIFPFILIQVYFVAGATWGRAARGRGRAGPARPWPWLAASAVALVVVMVLFHGKIVPARFVSTHPLNVLGLLYHLPLICTIIFGTMTFWEQIRRSIVYPWCALLGRHAMLAFVVHLYAAKAIGFLHFMTSVPTSVRLTLAVASVVMTVVLLRWYEREERSPAPGPSARALAVLFR